MRRPLHTAQSGYTLTELLISTAIMLAVTGAIFSMVAPAQTSGQVQPEMADLQQRMRVGSETLFKELVMAGAGPYQGATTGSLINFFAPILPRRTGRLNPDATQGAASFKTDVITLTYIPNTYSQTTISNPMPPDSSELKVKKIPSCPKGDELCGFEPGMNVIIFDETGNFDTFEVTHVQDSAGHLQHRGQGLNRQYDSGAKVTQIVNNTYYLNRETNQLMRYDGTNEEIALADDVVDLRFEYFGDPRPPTAPKPPLGVENCLYDAQGNLLGLPTLAPTDGSLAELTAAMLTDGPYCGSGGNQFDVDLLRIRKVRATIRMQVTSPSLRGTDPRLFMKPGTAHAADRLVPDYSVRFDVTPRNLNLAR